MGARGRTLEEGEVECYCSVGLEQDEVMGAERGEVPCRGTVHAWGVVTHVLVTPVRGEALG
jgi:hypothetical protein